MRLEIVNKHSVLKQVRDNGEWVGFIAPDKVNGFHVNGGWHIGIEITIQSDENDNYFVVRDRDLDTKEELEKFLSEFAVYNCNSELGYRVRFWEVR